MFDNVGRIIAWKYNAIPLRDFVVQSVDGQIAIVLWALPVTQPTIAELLSFEPAYLAAMEQDRPIRQAEQAIDKQARLLAALTLRLSSSWATMTVGEKNKVTTLIDNAGTKILNALRG